MKRIIFAIALIASSSAFADYDPFNAKPVSDAAVATAAQASPDTPVATSPAVNPSDTLDKALKGLLNDISVREEQDKAQDADVTEYIATANCVDIYYHTIEKRYEERKTKACINEAAKSKIIQEIKKNDTTHKAPGNDK